MHLAVTTSPPLVNLVDADQPYWWSKHFSRTFISFPLSFIGSSMEIYESNISLSLSDSLCGLCERWDSGIKPTCFASSQRAFCGGALTLSLSSRTHIHKCVFVCVSWHQCLRECEIDPGHRELSELFAPGETEWPPTYQPASLCGFSWQENPLFSFCLTQYARRSLTSPHHCSGWLLLEKLVCVNCF